MKNYIKLVGSRTREGLWSMNLNQDCKNSALLTQENEKTLKWHQKLGHLGKGNMRKLLTTSEGMNITEENLDIFNNTCEICLKAKQTKIPFGKERTRAKRPLEIIHTDVCGPIEPVT